MVEANRLRTKSVDIYITYEPLICDDDDDENMSKI
jgi:hypothetical protein